VCVCVTYEMTSLDLSFFTVLNKYSFLICRFCLFHIIYYRTVALVETTPDEPVKQSYVYL